MKKAQKTRRDFERIKEQLAQTRSIVRHTRSDKLWKHEAAVRKKLYALEKMRRANGLRGIEQVREGYAALLDQISERLLAEYNRQNGTSFDFEEVVRGRRGAYLRTGVMAVLLSSHIPSMAQRAFKKHFPRNPKDEYPQTRKMRRTFHLHLGETNTGKTYQALQALSRAETGVYLAPLRILALEVFETLNRNGIPCSLLTGEEEIVVEGARHVSSTVEKLDLSRVYDTAVVDEIQMISNLQRGQAWTRAVLGLRASQIHLCGALCAKDLLVRILEDCADAYDFTEYVRSTPLTVEKQPFTLAQVAAGDALVVFSRKKVLELAEYFQERGIGASMIYGDLPPEARRMQYARFLSGENKILVTTDAIGMGVNLPIRRIVFMSLEKFDGEEMRTLTPQEIKQIAGRAGRKGIYEVGYVACEGLAQNFIEESLQAEDEPLAQAVTAPGEAILDITGLSLSQKLALWSTDEPALAHYARMDVRDGLLILEAVKNFRLPEREQYRLMRLPFDVHNSSLLTLFTQYVQMAAAGGARQVPQPSWDGETLWDWELYYQKLNLYYSFSKTFSLQFEEAWVASQRQMASEKIDALLRRL